MWLDFSETVEGAQKMYPRKRQNTNEKQKFRIQK